MSRRWPTWCIAAAVSLLLAGHVFLAVSASTGKSATYDEPLHLAGGYAMWRGAYDIQPENGVLPQRWAALPLLFTDARFPKAAEHGRTSSIDTSLSFFHGMGNDVGQMLLLGRTMVALLSAATALLVFFWARALFGTLGGLVSLILCVFSPTMLAHGSVITSDMAVALLLTAGVGLCYWSTQQVTLGRMVVSGVGIGLVLAAKASGLLLLPMLGLLLGLRVLRGGALPVRLPGVPGVLGRWLGAAQEQGRRVIRGRRGQLAALLVLVAGQALVSWVVLWSFYGFSFQEGQLPELAQLPAAAQHAGLAGKCVLLAERWRLLPGPYLYGVHLVLRAAVERAAFLNGEVRFTGWGHFFPYCLLVKTPLSVFVLLGLALAAGVKRRWFSGGPSGGDRAANSCEDNWLEMDWTSRRHGLAAGFGLAPLWVLLGVYWAMALTTNLNIGHRHLLPTYPAMFILAGGAAAWLMELWRSGKGVKTVEHGSCEVSPSRARPEGEAVGGPGGGAVGGPSGPGGGGAGAWLGCVAVLALAAMVGESLWIRPNYLAYFNLFAGGPSQGYRHLVDSSLDWGQDLPALKQYLDQVGLPSRGTPVYLSYFGTAYPESYGIQVIPLPGFGIDIPPLGIELRPGVYCISATMLAGPYLKHFPGHWTAKWEEFYQQLGPQYVQIMQEVERQRAAGLKVETPARQWQLLVDYEELRLARLLAYLRQREPDEMINYSILVYRLSGAELEQALRQRPAELWPYAVEDRVETWVKKPAATAGP